MAQSMELEVIAEGVETDEQRQLLFNKGCKKFQGYLFGKPLPIEQFETELKRRTLQSDDEVHFGRHLKLLANNK
jgi:EAL domain-containing protein (putative c-di-GMP-specific phosphodiesterase class I)